MSNSLSFETRYFLRKWATAESSNMSEALIRNQLAKLFLNKDLTFFLEEFSSQFTGLEREQILLLCCKLLIQYPEKNIDREHYLAFQAEYDFEMANDSPVDGLTWIDAQLTYTHLMKEAQRGQMHSNEVKPLHMTQVQTKPIQVEKKFITKEEICDEFDWSDSTYSRRVEDGFPIIKSGKKRYANREKAYAWFEQHEPKKIQLSLAKKR